MTKRVMTPARWAAHQAMYRHDRQRAPVDNGGFDPFIATPPVDVKLYPLVALCDEARLPRPVPEYEFHPHRKWRFDYAWPPQKIAIEVDGGIWRGYGKGSKNTKAGAHSHPTAILRDMEKGNAAVLLGWRVLRFVPEELHHALPALQQLFGEAA